MKINAGKVMMAVIIALVAALLFALPDGAFGQSTDLTNPVLTYLDDHQVSYIAKMERSTLVIYLIKGSVNTDELADLANMTDVRVEVRDHLRL